MFGSVDGFWERLSITAALLLMFSAGLMALEMQSFDMEADDAGLTLKEFARQAKAGIVFDPESVKGVRTQEVTGMLLPSEALGRMLEGTPLVFKQDL